jgi:hypothetical protein
MDSPATLDKTAGVKPRNDTPDAHDAATGRPHTSSLGKPLRPKSGAVMGKIVVTLLVLAFILWRVGLFDFLGNMMPENKAQPLDRPNNFLVVIPYLDTVVKSDTGELFMSVKNSGIDDAKITSLNIINRDTAADCTVITKPPILLNSKQIVNLTAEACGKEDAKMGKIFSLQIYMIVETTAGSKKTVEMEDKMIQLLSLGVPDAGLNEYRRQMQAGIDQLGSEKGKIVSFTSEGSVNGMYI